jgi:hypothetical protein
MPRNRDEEKHPTEKKPAPEILPPGEKAFPSKAHEHDKGQKKEPEKPQGNDSRIPCPRCGTRFAPVPGEEAKCPTCHASLFECSACGSVVEESFRECPGCGAGFESAGTGTEEFAPVLFCPSCNFELSDNNHSYICAACGKGFCDRCMGHHIPPDSPRIEAKISYKYKLKESAFWETGTEKITAKMPDPLCPGCFDAHFDKTVEKLKVLAAQWRTDQLHLMSIKIIGEVYPESVTEQKKKLVASAQAFLKSIGSRKET